MTAFHADLAVIQLGGNDRDITVEGFQKPYEAIIRAIRAGNPQALILCLGNWAPPRGGLRQAGMIQAVCQAEHAQYVSTAAADIELTLGVSLNTAIQTMGATGIRRTMRCGPMQTCSGMRWNRPRR